MPAISITMVVEESDDPVGSAADSSVVVDADDAPTAAAPPPSADEADSGSARDKDADADQLARPVDVAAGSSFTLVLDSGGRVYSTGLNSHGQLGLGKPHAKDASIAGLAHIPKLVGVASIHAAGLSAAAILDDGVLVTWGYGRDGRLGVGLRASLALPTQVAALAGKHVVHVNMGGGRMAALVLAEDTTEVTDPVTACRTTLTF